MALPQRFFLVHKPQVKDTQIKFQVNVGKRVLKTRTATQTSGGQGRSVQSMPVPEDERVDDRPGDDRAQPRLTMAGTRGDCPGFPQTE